jgi:hypothetical protein
MRRIINNLFAETIYRYTRRSNDRYVKVDFCVEKEYVRWTLLIDESQWKIWYIFPEPRVVYPPDGGILPTRQKRKRNQNRVESTKQIIR